LIAAIPLEIRLQVNTSADPSAGSPNFQRVARSERGAGGHFTRAVLVQTLLSAIPAAILLMAGKAILAGTVFWSIFGLSMLQLSLEHLRSA
jgi:hypothetical protein